MPADRIVLDLERNDRASKAALRIRIVANGAVVGEQTVAGPGRFSVSIPYDRALATPTEVTLLSNRAFAGGFFSRRRSCVLRGTAWFPADQPDWNHSPVAGVERAP
jgi:hypothetical protein